MALTREQTEKVRNFINKRGFNTIEVEIEILDHVACAVEEALEKDPDINIDKAIENVHRSFGVMGFSVVEDNLAAALGQKLGRMYRNELWSSWFSDRLLKVLCTTLLLFFTLTMWANLFSPGLFKVIAFFTLGLLAILPPLYHQRIFKKWSKRSLVMGRLLWPFIFGSFSVIYVINLLPTDLITTDRMLFNGIILGLSIIASTTLWASFSFTKKVYAWAEERWLKYSF